MRRRKGSAVASEPVAVESSNGATSGDELEANGVREEEASDDVVDDVVVELDEQEPDDDGDEYADDEDEDADEDEEGDDEEGDGADGDESEESAESDADGDDGEASDEDDSDSAEETESNEESEDSDGELSADAGSEPTGDDLTASEGGDEDEVPAAGGDGPPLASVIEGVLFASAEPVPMRRLVRLLSSWSRDEVEQGVQDLRAGLEAADRGVRLVEAAGGLQLRSSERLAPWVRRFFSERPPRLSRPVLETLAIVAYRQPVTRGEIEQIRGVNCDAVLGALTARGLIQITGRRASPGRPGEYGTTSTFLELFTLRDLAELPPLPDPTALANLVVGETDGEADGDEADRESDADGTGDETSGEGSRDAESTEENASESKRGEGESFEGEAPEDSQPGGDGLAEDGGGSDPERPGEGERPGGPGAGDEGGSDPGSDHG